MTNREPLRPRQMPERESAYREDDLKTRITSEQMLDYCMLNVETQVYVAHLVFNGIPFNEAKGIALKTDSSRFTDAG